MGNTPSNKQKQNKKPAALQQQLKTFRLSQQEAVEQNYIQTSQCCWFEINSHKKRKIIWENNFIAYCDQIKNEFKWAAELIYLVRSNIRSKAVFFKQIQQLKTLIKTSSVMSSDTEREILITPSEVEQFKSNLKRSVLLSSSQANKYHDSSQKKVATMSGMSQRPSRIQFNRFNENGALRRSTVNKRVQSRGTSFSSRSGLRKSIMSFVDDTLSSVFGAQREISKQMANNLQIFLKFSMMLQKHFNNPDCMFFHIRRKFIDFVCLNYTDTLINAQSMAHFVDSINQFMVILKEAIIDYYHLTSFGEGQTCENPFIANQQNILSLCRTLFFKEKNFYEVIFNNVIKFNQKREANFQQIIKLLQGSSPETFFVKDKFCLNQRTINYANKEHLNNSQNLQEEQVTNTPQLIQDVEPYRQCKLILNELEKSMTPVSKMKIMLSCSEMMNKEIEKFYDVNAIQREKWVLDADQVLSIFCYLIVGTKIEHLHSHLFIMDNFSTNSQMISIFGYYLSVMNCAIEQLESDYLDKVSNERSVRL